MAFPVFRVKNSFEPPWKPSHIRRIYPADARQNHLPAVEMAGKYTVNIPLLHPIILQPGDREVAEQNFIAVGVLKIPQKHALTRVGFAGFELFVREAVTVDAADAEGLAINGDVLILVI